MALTVPNFENGNSMQFASGDVVLACGKDMREAAKQQAPAKCKIINVVLMADYHKLAGCRQRIVAFPGFFEKCAPDVGAKVYLRISN